MRFSEKIHAVILAGGSGERFWPLSTPDKPKQFLRLISEETLIEQTVNRLSSIVSKDHLWVVSNQKYDDEIKKHLPSLPYEHVLLEPIGKNTAPAIGFAAVKLRAEDPEAIMAVLPSDHNINDPDRFHGALKFAAQVASKTKSLVTFGIVPDRPATGYGYIEVGEELIDSDNFACHSVVSFKEKPDPPTAEKYLKDGKHFWNSGMFVWKVDVVLEEIRKHAPKLSRDLELLSKFIGTKSEREKINEFYERVDNISIDYGLMEKSSKAVVIESSFGWDDVGSWLALERLHQGSSDGVVSFGDCEILDTENSILYSESGKIAAFGVNDLIIVRTKDVTLVCHKSQAEEMKKLVEKLKT